MHRATVHTGVQVPVAAFHLRTHGPLCGLLSGARPHPSVGEPAEEAHTAHSEIKVCCPPGPARRSLNHKALAAARDPPGGGTAPAHLDEEVADAPQTVGNAGLVLAQSVVVGDAHVVHILEERVLLGEDQRIQALGARLLHALQAEADVDGDFLGGGGEGGSQ